MASVSAILLAGGQGTRFGAPTPKQFNELSGKVVALYSLELFQSIPWIDEIIVVCEDSYRHHFPQARFAKPGKRRQDSLYNGLQHASGEWILVHDSARPLLLREDLEALKKRAIEIGAATLATPVKMTIKEANDEKIVMRTLCRDQLWDIQTPQMIRQDLLKRGFEMAIAKNLDVTDDVSLVELIGEKVALVPANPCNLKITTAIDMKIAEGYLCHAIG